MHLAHGIITSKVQSTAMEIVTISETCIKPSSPTPSHLKTFKLSKHHQHSPDIPFFVIFFYPASSIICSTDHDDRYLNSSQLLKEALSKTLTSFYPFAGRFQNDDTIICNDDGVLFIEARTATHLSDFLTHPDLMPLGNHLISAASISTDAEKTIELISNSSLLHVKFTLFGCGGYAISISMTHKIADAASIVTLIRNWTASCRSSNRNIGPIVLPDLSILGRTISDPGATSSVTSKSTNSWGPPNNKECSSKRFFFSASKIDQLKTQVVSEIGKSPSRVDVVLALIWKCSLAAASRNSPMFRPSIMLHVVNLRPFMNPPLQETCLGNLGWQFPIMVENESDMDLHELVKKLVAMKAYAHEMTKSFHCDDQQDIVEEVLEEVEKERNTFFRNNWKKDIVFYVCTSWCRLSLYETDFGWGKPVWVNNTFKPNSLMVNAISLMDSKEFGGIEALVHLYEEDMSVFECNEEFLQFAAVNPSII